MEVHQRADARQATLEYRLRVQVCLLLAPAISRAAILEEGRAGSGDLTVRVWTLFTEDNVYATEGLPAALRAIHFL